MMTNDEWDEMDNLDLHPDNVKAANEKFDVEEVFRGKLTPDFPGDLPENRQYDEITDERGTFMRKTVKSAFTAVEVRPGLSEITKTTP